MGAESTARLELAQFLERAQRRRRLTTVAALLLVAVVLLFSASIGLAVAFAACFKQSCSDAEGLAWIWLPMVSLPFSLPVAGKLRRTASAEYEAKVTASSEYEAKVTASSEYEANVTASAEYEANVTPSSAQPPVKKLGDQTLVTACLAVTGAVAALAATALGVQTIGTLTNGSGSLETQFIASAISGAVAMTMAYLSVASFRSL